MKINHKLSLGFGLAALLIGVAGIITVEISKNTIKEAIANATILLAEEIIYKIDREIFYRMESIHSYTSDLLLQDELKKSNADFKKLTDIEGYIDQKDIEWRKTAKKEISPFIKSLINNKLSRELKAEIEFYKKRDGHYIYSELFVTNSYGANIAQTGKTSDYRQNDEKWWQTAKENEVYIMDYSFDESSGVYSISICLRVDSENGEFLGVMKVVLNIADVFKIIKNLEKENTYSNISRHFFLVDKEGQIIYSIHGKTFLEKQDPDLVKLINSNINQKYFVREDSGNSELISIAKSKGYKYFNGLGWTLAVVHNTDEIFAPANKLRTKLLNISVLLVGISILVSFFISRSISGPLLKLKEATLEIGQGIFHKKVDLKSKDEIGDLVTAFNSMTKHLNLTTVSKNYMDNILFNLRDMLIIIDENLNIKRTNPATLNALEYKKEDLLGKSITNIFSNKSNEGLVPALNDLINNKTKGFNIEKDLLSSDENLIPVIFSASKIIDNNGSVTNIICTAVNLTEQKEKEKIIISVSDELKIKTDNLEKANIQLKSATQGLIQAEKLTALGELTAGVAHELNQPLNGIKIICQSVKRDIVRGDFEEKEIDRDLTDIISQVDKMAEIINHMRLFTRRSEGEVRELVKINDIVMSPLKLLGQQFATHNIEIILELSQNLPHIKVDIITIEQVIMNLITNARNAVEDKKDKKMKIILKTYEVKKEDSPISKDSLVFEIKDNGAGIKEEIINKIFQPFFTTKEPGKGTGLGLSVSLKIIEEHKGLIKCESISGEGTTFKVFIPLG